jgi:uncharacterized protein YwbE
VGFIEVRTTIEHGLKEDCVMKKNKKRNEHLDASSFGIHGIPCQTTDR